MCLCVALNPGWQAALMTYVCAEYSAPKEGSQQLEFDTKYPKPMYAQFVAIFTKFMAAYWRMPVFYCFGDLLVNQSLGRRQLPWLCGASRTQPALTQG